MSKTTSLCVRLEPSVKQQAEQVLSQLGLSASAAVDMFYRQIILNRGLPFVVTTIANRPLDVTALSAAELNAELEKGYKQAANGQLIPADDVFAKIRRELVV